MTSFERVVFERSMRAMAPEERRALITQSLNRMETDLARITRDIETVENESGTTCLLLIVTTLVVIGCGLIYRWMA